MSWVWIPDDPAQPEPSSPAPSDALRIRGRRRVGAWQPKPLRVDLVLQRRIRPRARRYRK